MTAAQQPNSRHVGVNPRRPALSHQSTQQTPPTTPHTPPPRPHQSLPPQVLESRGGTILFDPGSLGGLFVGCMFFDDMSGAEELELLIELNLALVSVRIYGGFIFVGGGTLRESSVRFFTLIPCESPEAWMRPPALSTYPPTPPHPHPPPPGTARL